MPTNGMTIDSLNTVSSLTAQDEVPVWDKEASDEHTRKITAQNMANSVKTLGSLVNTTEMNAAIAQSTASTVLFNGALSLTDTTYDLSENASNYLFISIETKWYGGEMPDNVVLIPSRSWITNEYFDMHRHNDNSAPYLRINERLNTSINAKVTDVGIYVRICGICRI